jgi:hypothetical protein
MHGQGLGALPSFWNHASRRRWHFVSFSGRLRMLEERSKNGAGKAGRLGGLRLDFPPHASLQGRGCSLRQQTLILDPHSCVFDGPCGIP